MLKEIIPIIEVKKANRTLKEKINNEQVVIPDEIEQIDIKYMEEEYKSVIEVKNRFEDKAKTILAALTIAITLILNLSKIIDAIATKFDFKFIEVLVFILSVFAIVYMLMAGVMSIQVLIKENIGFSIPIEERKNNDKKQLYKTIQLNVYQNLVRNNIIFSAYQSIRNSVICLVVLFVIAVFPTQVLGKNLVPTESVFSYENICFEIDAVKWITDNNLADVSLDRIVKQYDKNNSDGSIKRIYDEEKNFIVIIRKTGDSYIIENIISGIEKIE